MLSQEKKHRSCRWWSYIDELSFPRNQYHWSLLYIPSNIWVSPILIRITFIFNSIYTQWKSNKIFQLLHHTCWCIYLHRIESAIFVQIMTVYLLSHRIWWWDLILTSSGGIQKRKTTLDTHFSLPTLYECKCALIFIMKGTECKNRFHRRFYITYQNEKEPITIYRLYA